MGSATLKRLKVEDIKELQELVGEHLEALEPGLKLLDTRAHLGGATMDLVAVDAHGGLALIALSFVADDEMVLRALEAYSWCQEYPEAVEKRYPTARAAVPQKPRVFFVVERTSDGFFRKLKHLRFERVECREFHFGLAFTPIEPPRGGEVPVEPISAPVTDGAGATERPVPAAARAAEPPPPPVVPPAAESRAELLEGLSVPPDLSPAWQRAVGPPASGVDETKVRAVREYLQKEFPTAIIYDFYAHDRGVQVFHLQDNQGVIVHSATVVEDLLNGVTETQLRQFFDKHKLARVLRQAGQAGVSVTKSGLKIERR